MDPLDDPEIIEWLYGPPGYEDDEPESAGEVYKRQEEEERIRWLPGYYEAIKTYLREARAWHARWKPGSAYPPEPASYTAARVKLSEMGKNRARPPWEASEDRSS